MARHISSDERERRRQRILIQRPWEKNIGRKLTKEHIEKIGSHLRKGKTHEEIFGNRSQEIKEKCRASNLKTWSNPKLVEAQIEIGRQGALSQERKGKTYEEIYGEDAEVQRKIRSDGHRNNGRLRVTVQRDKHNSDHRYTDWRTSVFEHDNYTCQNPECGVRGGQLHAHHIKEWAKFPEFRYEVWNGITLCIECHKALHANRIALPELLLI